MDKNLNIINPEDKDYYDGKLYMVGLYPGAGAELKTFYVYGEYEGEALESVVAYLDLSSETGLLLDMDEVEDIVYDDYGEEYNNWLLEHPESDWFEFANEYLGYIYVDATMKGASQPYYVEGNYLRIEEVENKEAKTESKEDLDINSDKVYKKVQVTFECGDCGHREKWSFDDMTERELAELDASDSNDLVGDCPRCDSMMYYMTDYKIIKENKEVKTEAYSKDELKELLNNGEILKVGQANFKFENGQVWFYDPSITFGWENKHPRLKTVDDLVNHLDKLQSNKYKINVVSKDAKEKSGKEMYDLLKATNVKNWYKDTFPQDELADEINDSITFYDVFNALDNHKDIYNLLGVGDSVVRERVFNALDDILDEPEGYSYEQWTLTEGKEIKIESVEPEENKKLDLKDRVKYAYENCNYSKRKDMPTVSDIMDYLGLDTYNNKLYNQISDILYELGYDWQLESKQIQSDKEIKTEDFKPATVEENPEIKDPHFWWEDKDTFIMEFEGGVDNEGDKYWYLVEYWADEDTYHFFKQYDYDTIVLNLPEDKKEQIINMMKAKMN